MARLANSLGGFVMACGLSQFPEYSQQYVQRLGGAVDELRTFVTDFDASALKVDKTREQALSEMTGTQFLESREADMTRTITRFTRLDVDYANMKDASTFGRLTHLRGVPDTQVMSGAWEDFKPALPLTLDGLLFLLSGYFMGYAGTAGFGRAIGRFRERLPTKRRAIGR